MTRERKNKLRLPNYDYSSDGAYFITVCVKDRKQLLSRIIGVDDCIALMSEENWLGSPVGELSAKLTEGFVESLLKLS